MIWKNTAVSTSLFTDFPHKNFFNGHHCFSKYIADEKRICRVKFSHYKYEISFIIFNKKKIIFQILEAVSL